MESINAFNIKSFLFSNSLISDHQLGFRPGHFTLDMLLLLSQQWVSNSLFDSLFDLNVKHEIRTIYLDIYHAFDAVILPCSRNSLLLTSKANSTLGLLTTFVANMRHSTERHCYPFSLKRPLGNPTIYLLNITLQNVHSFKLLGLMISHDLAWTNHF